MGHRFKLVGPSQAFQLENCSLDKPDLEEGEAAMKPDVLRAPKMTYANTSFFLFHSCFQTLPHHYPYTDPTPTQTWGEFRESEETQYTIMGVV